MNKIISVVGIVLIVAAGLVASLSASKEDILKSKKIICEKYVKNAQQALKSGDFKSALKFAKLAIKADPENKAGFKVLTQIADAKCKASMPAVTKTTVTPAAKPAKEATPAKPAPAEEEEMGC